MRALVIVVCVACASVFTLTPTNVAADEECVAGYRDVTQGERAAMLSVLERALQALPAAPNGWVVTSDDSLYVTPSICRDHESSPWSYDLSRSYQRVDNVEERDRALGDAAAKNASAMKAKQPRMDAITAKIQELSMAAVAAAEKGDYAKVDEINVELDQASAEMERLMAEGGTLDQIDAANREANRDNKIDIEVSVNSGYESVDYDARDVPGPAGAEHAYRWSGSSSSETDETALILFGRWETAGNGVGVQPTANAAPTAAQAISVRVSADAGRIQSILDAIDFSTLAALARSGTGH